MRLRNELREGVKVAQAVDRLHPASIPIVRKSIKKPCDFGVDKWLPPKSPKSQKKMYDTPDSPSVDEIKELLPEKYNAQSQIKLTVKAGTQEEKYELKTK
jgi:hypothetical protein